MKLATLLVQYLHANKRLELPGIGSFMLNASAPAQSDSGKNSKTDISEHISFESNPNLKDSGELISFICEQTGKMKPLAAADLNSHLELARQFLNIGKPYLFEGIASLVKTKSGDYELASAVVFTEKNKEISEKENITSSTGENFCEYHNLFKQKVVKTKWKKPAVAFLLLAGLGLAIWGGYSISGKNQDAAGSIKISSSTVQNEQLTMNGDAPLQNDTVQNIINTPDSAGNQTQTPHTIIAPSAGNYKFILETAKEKRANQRFNKLKSYDWQVQMETSDSVEYKLFLVISAAVTDTARIADSLSKLNGRKVYAVN